jgi:hypothetical protein
VITITPVPRQAAHSSSSAFWFGFLGYMKAFLLQLCSGTALPPISHFDRFSNPGPEGGRLR